MAIFLAAVNPSGQIEKANCITECSKSGQARDYCSSYCLKNTNFTLPSPTPLSKKKQDIVLIESWL